MFRMGVIEESLENAGVLDTLKPFFYSQRLEEVLDDEFPLWHTNEYHVPDENINDLISILEQQVKLTWYVHAFNDEKLIVIFRGKSFHISPHRDDTWNAMIEYGDTVKVERRYSESIPLSV
ncbi:MAG: hypothetical protein FWC16_12115 [Defluviitaleaceae bacterium]|nr:hypothetical protein [Defluviitaleaceae bacterium]MCL2275664.1 hypothetical protein [Defluviitaleaceae bacterium]